MTRYGYFLASEEHEPQVLVRQAKLAEEAGFDALWISDHFHPWLDEQGQSGFVWSVIGAISQVTSLPITTQASTRSPSTGQGRPTTAASVTAACAISTFSTSTE